MLARFQNLIGYRCSLIFSRIGLCISYSHIVLVIPTASFTMLGISANVQTCIFFINMVIINTHMHNITDKRGRVMTTQKHKRIAFWLLVCAVMVVLSACATQPLRLHVIANSNSEDDQTVKLIVRDAVLTATKEGIQNCGSAAEAEEYINKNIGIILMAANDTLAANGLNYRASANVGTYHFPDREYNGVTYPEGEYRALRVVLGEGKGDNWWCVMFPPLCITEIEPDTEEVEVKSIFAELWASMFGS